MGSAQTLVGDGYITIGEQPSRYFDRNQPFSFGLWFRIEKAGASGPLVTRSGGVMNGNRGYEVMLRAGRHVHRRPASRRAGQLARDRDDEAGDDAGRGIT